MQKFIRNSDFNSLVTLSMLLIAAILFIVVIATSDKTTHRQTGLTWIEINGVETQVK